MAAVFFSCAKTPLAPILNTETVEMIGSLRYHKGFEMDAERHSLDLYLPTSGSNWPTALIVHGGGWVVNDKQVIGNLGYALANTGIAAVCINYRLYPRVQFPDNVKDVAKAVAWTRENIGGYGANPDDFFLIGYSAGALMAALVALDPKYLKQQGYAPDIFKGVAVVSGVYDVKAIPYPLRMVFTEQPAVWRSASPVNHIKPGSPRFLILYAQNDMELNDKRSVKVQSRQFATALSKHGVSTQIFEIPGCNHDQIMEQVGREKGSETFKRLLEFISSGR